MTTTTAPPTLPEVTAAIVRSYVGQAAGKDYRGAVIGLRGRLPSPLHLEVDGASVRAVFCPSALAVAAAMRERAPGAWLFVVTDRTDADLGRGITAHFVHQRLVMPNLWDVVQDRFAAQRLQPLLVREGRALAEALLAESPPDGWPPAAGGEVTLDFAYEALACRVLGLRPDRLDALGLLEWTLDPTGPIGLARLADPVRGGVLRWLAARTGTAGAPTLAVVSVGRAADALPIALAVGALHAAADRVRAAEARGRLTAGLGAGIGTGDSTIAWSDAARAVLETQPAAMESLLRRAATLLDDSGGTFAAATSDVLRDGFLGRLRTFATAIGTRQLSQAELTYAELSRHLLAEREPSRSDTALMALRLLRWLNAGASSTPTALSEAVGRHVSDDGWVDRARADVWVGDEDSSVASAYQGLYTEVTDRRAVHDERFAALLVDATGSNAPLTDVVPVEDLVRRIVLPIAAQLPVLLAVVDGMSVGVATEIIDGLAADGWVEHLPAGAARRGAALAALPSVTSVSRTSLFTGGLRKGDQTAEKLGLSALAAAAGLTAVVLHKADLDRSTAGQLLPVPVLEALAGPDRIVGVVFNTVDDALDRSDPGATKWDLDAVKHLRPLLRAARDAGRVVVLTSDHGHVIERRDGTQLPAPDATSSRWRPASTPPRTGEILVAGSRVVTADHKAVLPWQESLRYKPLQAGYHGGASTAEVVIPLTVHAPAGIAVTDWSPAPLQVPGWWLGIRTGEAPAPAPDGTLFPVAAPPDGLVGSLFASDVYQAQRRRAKRVAVPDTTVAAVLGALLDAPAYRLPQAAAAAVAEVPEFRLPGVVAHLQRLLNVDGYDVLAFDIDGVTLVLDRGLLAEQFGL